MNDEFTYGNRHSRPGFACWKIKATAAELKAQSKVDWKHSGLHGYFMTEDQMQTFIDQVCKEQREKCLSTALTSLSSEEFNAIINAPKPDGL